MRLCLFLSILAMCPFGVLAQPELTTRTAIVSGTVVTEDGGPVSGLHVTITIGGKQAGSVFSKSDGTFSIKVPPGTGTVAAPSVTVPIIVAPGQTLMVKLMINPTTGVLIIATHPDGKPFELRLQSAAARKPGTRGRFIMFVPRLRAGLFWLADVKPEETELAVRAELRGSFMHGAYLQQWTFTGEEPLRKVIMTVPYPVHVVMTLVDEDGKPVTETPVQGIVSRWYPSALPFGSRQVDSYLDGDLRLICKPCVTDAQGQLDFGNLVPQTYYLTLATGDREGKRTVIEVKADGTFAPQTYRLHSTRVEVRQAVFRADGQPAADAVVYASYCQGGRVAITRGTTDAKGEVIWKNLPHSRVIISGPQVAAGVIPAEGTTFHEPLPAPTAEGIRRFCLEPRVDGTKPITFGVVVLSGEKTYSNHEDANLNENVSGSGWSQVWELQTGAPFSYLWGATFSSVAVHWLSGAYIPYLEEGIEQIDLPVDALPLTELTGVEVRGQLLTAAGTPAAGILVKVLPGKENALYESLMRGKVDWLLTPAVDARGIFTLSLPPTGEYELHTSVDGKTFKLATTLTVNSENTPAVPVEVIVPGG